MSMCLHRYWSHKGFQCGRAVQFVLYVLGCMASQGPPLWWASKHRRHHAHCDTDEDPHSPVAHGPWCAVKILPRRLRSRRRRRRRPSRARALVAGPSGLVGTRRRPPTTRPLPSFSGPASQWYGARTTFLSSVGFLKRSIESPRRQGTLNRCWFGGGLCNFHFLSPGMQVRLWTAAAPFWDLHGGCPGSATATAAAAAEETIAATPDCSTWPYPSPVLRHANLAVLAALSRRISLTASRPQRAGGDGAEENRPQRRPGRGGGERSPGSSEAEVGAGELARAVLPLAPVHPRPKGAAQSFGRPAAGGAPLARAASRDQPAEKHPFVPSGPGGSSALTPLAAPFVPLSSASSSAVTEIQDRASTAAKNLFGGVKFLFEN